MTEPRITTCTLCTAAGLDKCPYAQPCGSPPVYTPLVQTSEQFRRIRAIAGREDWCTSDNIVLAQGPRK